MNKEELFRELSDKISKGEITYDEMMNRFNLTPIVKEVPVNANQSIVKHSDFSITKLLYALGAIIVVVGVILFTYQIWNDIGSFGRISVTLGLGLLITGIGSYLLKNKPKENIGMVFHFIGGMLIPGGAVVTIYELGSGQIELWPLAIIFGIVFAFYLLINSVHKSVILTFLTIANGTAFIYQLVAAITDGMFNNNVNLYAYLTIVLGVCYIQLASVFKNTWNDRLIPPLYLFGFVGIQIAIFSQYINSFSSQNSIWPVVLSTGAITIYYLLMNLNLKNSLLTLLTIANGTAFVYLFVDALIGRNYNPEVDVYTYLTMIMGVVYLLLSHSFKNTWNSRLTEILNLFGIIALLGAAYSEIFNSLPWQMLFFLLVIGGFALSIYVKSLGVLVVSTLFLLAFVSYITSEYFADSIGWPISLVILGFIFIGLGYLSITINRKYIKQ